MATGSGASPGAARASAAPESPPAIPSTPEVWSAYPPVLGLLHGWAPLAPLGESDLSALPGASVPGDDLLPEAGDGVDSEGELGDPSATAPSAALMSAVQAAVAASSSSEQNNSDHVVSSAHETPQSTYSTQPPGVVDRLTMLAIREASVGRGSVAELRQPAAAADGWPRGSPSLMPRDSPVLAPRSWEQGRSALSADPPAARRRWASFSGSECDEASPMLWPSASPLLRAGYRSRGSTPLFGPNAAHPGVSGPLAKAVAAAAGDMPGSPFMLPQSHNAEAVGELAPCLEESTPSQALAADFALSADAQEFTPGVLAINEIMTPELGQSSPPLLPSTGAMWQNVEGLTCDGLLVEAMPVDMPFEAFGMDILGVDALADGFEPQEAQWLPDQVRGFTGWTVIWIGERAFRASGAKKDQIGQEGFLVKVYRSQDKCCRALGKKAAVPKNTVFLVSEAESRGLIAYLLEHGAGDLQVIVDADGGAGSPERLLEELGLPEDHSHGVAIAQSWDDIMCVLRNIATVACCMAGADAGFMAPAGAYGMCEVPALLEELAEPEPSGGGGKHKELPKGGGGGAAAATELAGASSAGADAGANADGADGKWTLLWVSELAFKPSAVALKARLEALGCQVKGYKTHRNAARALDKKRTLTRTIALVSSGEAVPLLAYFASRPELGTVPAVVEAAPRGAPIRSSEHVEVVEDFEAAVAAIQRVAACAGFT